jgi:sugar lactone lactonase YvrE
VSKRHRKESTSEEWRLRAPRTIVALFAALLVSLTLTAAASANVSFTRAWGWGVADGAIRFEICISTCRAGRSGGGAGQLASPWGIATDPSGDVYVGDYANTRIDEFSAAGAFIKAYGWGVSDGASKFETCTTTCQAGIGGGGAGQFNHLAGVATDSSGDVYVADWNNERIDEFSPRGAFMKAYGWGVADGASRFETCTTTCQQGLRGGGAGELFDPQGVATDSSGDVYVAGASSQRIDEFSAGGAFMKAYGWGVADGASRFETCTTTCQRGLYGDGAGQLAAPTGVAIAPSGDVYVADSANYRIDEFSAGGSFLKAYGGGVVDGASQVETCTSTCRAGIAGEGAGQLALRPGYPEGVATDSSGDVYVADAGNFRIDEFSAGGSFIAAYGWGVVDGASQFETCTSTCRAGLFTGGAGAFSYPQSVATDSAGGVYVADSSDNRIEEFSAAGASSYALSVSLAGTGKGSVSGSGISCPSTCLKNYASGTVVTLTATPSAGSTFAGWSGCNTTAGDQCSVTITADRGVTARFRLLPPGTKITKSQLEQKQHQAKFSFKAIGTATGFQCALVRTPKAHHKKPKPSFSACRSPETYKQLKAGKYTFEVRAFNAAGADQTPAKARFTVH